MGEFKTISNVDQFIELQTRHAQRLQRDGFVFQDPIPAFLRPFTQVMRGWPGNQDWAWDWSQAGSTGRAIAPEDRAPFGEFDTYQIVAKPPFEVAGHTHYVKPEDFDYPMAADIAGEKAMRPAEEWFRAINEGVLDVATSGAFFSATDARTDGTQFSATSFNGDTVTVSSATESSTVATPSVAHSSHLVEWPDRRGGTFAAGQNHLPADTGADWTEADGVTARDTIMQYPGVTGVDAFVGPNVVDDIEAVVETARSSTESGVTFEQGGAVESDFGTVQFIAEHDNVRYFRTDDLGADDLGVYVARNRTPLAVVIGKARTNGRLDLPGAWNELSDPETKIRKFGYRGYAAAYVKEPTSIFIHNYA